ncbi:hypothetical protein ACHAXH_000338 [Discostella pseudostelligera]
MAEEALFDFNKRCYIDNHAQEEEEEQQHQNQVDERVGPNNSNENDNDGHDASVTVSSVSSGEKHSKKFKSGDADNNNSSSSKNNINCLSSSSLLPMPSGVIHDIIIIGNIQPYQSHCMDNCPTQSPSNAASTSEQRATRMPTQELRISEGMRGIA